MVNQQGKVYEKGLGDDMALNSASLQEYDLDDTWKLTKDEKE